MTNVREIQSRALWVLNKIAQGAVYGLCEERCANDAKDAWKKFNDSLKKDKLIDWDNLTIEECKALRFGVWMSNGEVNEEIANTEEKFAKGEIDEAKRDDLVARFENVRNMMLIPLYLFEQIPEGQLVYTIGGEAFYFERENADKDIRFGCLSYGIKTK